MDPTEPHVLHENPEAEIRRLSSSRSAWRMFALVQAFWIVLVLLRWAFRAAP